MKYVVLQHPTKSPAIVLGLMLTHEDLAAPYKAQGYRATSAGFVRLAQRLDPNGIAHPAFETFGWSNSLQLTPARGDTQLIAAMHHATLKTAPVIPSALEPAPVAAAPEAAAPSAL